jgi:hypothetical protein
MNKFARASLAVLAAATLVACGGNDDTTFQRAPATTTLNASSTSTAGLAGVSLVAPSGIAALGTTASTTISIGGTAGAQTASISSGGNTATTRLSFGSCIFTVITSTFPSTHPLAAGKTITINPCQVTASTANATVGGPATNTTVSLVLGTTPVSGTAPVSVGTSGSITINNSNAGTTTLSIVSGG